VVVPPELEAIIREVEADENRMVEIGKKLGIEMAVSEDPEMQKLWVMQRAWGKWAMQQPGEKLSGLVGAMAEMFYPRTENWALLREAAHRLEKTKPRKDKVRHNDPSSATAAEKRSD
jgi:hypothetical protein